MGAEAALVSCIGTRTFPNTLSVKGCERVGANVLLIPTSDMMAFV